MPAKKTPPPDEKPQYERFLEAAREHGTSEDPEVFERIFAKVVKPRGVNREETDKSSKNRRRP